MVFYEMLLSQLAKEVKEEQEELQRTGGKRPNEEQAEGSKAEELPSGEQAEGSKATDQRTGSPDSTPDDGGIDGILNGLEALSAAEKLQFWRLLPGYLELELELRQAGVELPTEELLRLSLKDEPKIEAEEAEGSPNAPPATGSPTDTV